MLTLILLIVMLVAFILSSIKLKSPDISMVVAAVVLAIAGVIAVPELGSPVRYLVEGLFVNLDLAMLFIAASVFVNIYAHSGAISTLTRGIVSKVGNKWALMAILGVLMLLPGAITGAGSVSIFVLGGLVDIILSHLGINQKKRTVFIFFFAILSAAAPPVNLWTMMMCAQANMPYVGFAWLLLIPIIIAGAVCIVYVGWGAKPEPKEDILAQLPQKTEGMTWWRIALPVFVIALLFVLAVYAPWNLPVLGLPLMFIISAVVALLCNPKKTTMRPAGKHLPQPAADPDLLPHRRHRPHHAGLLQLRCRSRPRRTAHLHVQHLRNGCHGHLRRPVPHLPDGRRPSSFKDHRPPRLRADEVRRFLYRLPEECAGSDARAWRHGRRHDRHARDIRFHVLIGGLPWYSFRT